MSSFQVQIEDLVGTGAADTSSYTDWLTAGGKFIVDLLPESKLFTSDITDTGNGVSISNYRFIRAHKLGYKARKIDPGLQTQAKDSTSIYKASLTDPVYYIENGSLFVLPSGGTGIGMVYPTINYSASSISNFPPEMYESVVLYACIRCLEKLITDNQDIKAGGTAPTALSAPSFSYSNAAYTNTNITATVNLTSRLATLTTDLDTNEDIELAQAKINEIRTIIEQFNTESQIALNQAQFNAESTTDLDLQNKLQTLQASIQQYQSTVGRYSQELNKYQSDINARVQKISVLDGQIKYFQAEFDKSLQVLK